MKKIPIGKIPPQSLEAEESILSSILLNKGALLEIIEILKPEHFYKEAHKKIYQSIIEMFEKNEPADLVTITNRLREQKMLSAIGGATYISRLIDSIPMAVNIVHYAKIVREKAILRMLIHKANEVIARSYDAIDLSEVLDFAEKSIYEVSQDKINKSFSKLKDVIFESFNILEKRGSSSTNFSGLETGFKDFDKITSGLQKSDLLIIAARPGMGKTAYALNIARNVCNNDDVGIAFFSLEMSKEQLALRLLCAESEINSEKIRNGELDSDDWDKLRYAGTKLAELPIFINDTPSISVMEIRAISRKLKKDHNISLVIVDYLQLMKTKENAERRDLAIAEISAALKAMAKELNIPVIALSQLNRKLEERADKRPILSDLRESGAIEQDADIVIFIYRDEIYNKNDNNPDKGTAEILIRKHRNGKTGVVKLRFLDVYTKFE